MIQFIIPDDLKCKTPFQPIDENLLIEEDIIDLILRCNEIYEHYNDNEMYDVYFNNLRTGDILKRKVRCIWLIDRVQKYHGSLLDKYKLLMSQSLYDRLEYEGEMHE